MKMIKTLALAVLTPTLIKAASEGYEWVCIKFSSKDEPVKPVRKKVDITKLSIIQVDFIRTEFKFWSTNNKYAKDGNTYKNQHEFTAYLNKRTGLNKSRTFYQSIWKNK